LDSAKRIFSCTGASYAEKFLNRSRGLGPAIARRYRTGEG
jgi:hypothetical protein